VYSGTCFSQDPRRRYWKDISCDVTRTLGQPIAAEQCWQRYFRYVDPTLKDKYALLGEPWTHGEECMLCDVVAKYQGKGQRGGINWKMVGNEMKRPYVECRSKLRSLNLRNKRKKRKCR
jgi:hypothetical protein